MFRLLLVFAATAVFAGAHAQTVHPGCTTRYAYEGNLLDSVGSVNGSATGPVAYSAGRFGQALNFSGTTKVTYGDVGKFGTTDFSVSYWSKATTRDQRHVLGRRGICNVGSFWNFRSGAAGIVLEIDQSSESNRFVVLSASDLADGVWHHVVGIREGTQLSLIIDGAVEATTTILPNLNISNNSAPFRAGFGVCEGFGEKNFLGSLDEIQFYPRALSLLEARQLGEFGGITPVTLSGKVQLEDWSLGSAGYDARVELLRGEKVLDTMNTTLDAAGNYSVTTTQRGPFRVSVKTRHWLSGGANTLITDAGASGMNHTLLNGDTDGDNYVGTDDYLIINGSFDLSQGDAGYDPRADITGDAYVGTDDYLIVNANFDKKGD